jgi:hypothetical protein
MDFLIWLEDVGGLGTFVRESPSILGYPTFIVLHTLGLSTVVGTSTLVGIRVLGFADSIPLPPLERLFPVMWAGFWVNTFSGSGLALATASGQFTNPLFLIKISLVIAAVLCMRQLRKKVFLDPAVVAGGEPQAGKALAATMLVLWMFAMIAGRLIAYSGVIIGR